MKQGQKQDALSRLKQVVAQHPENVDAAVMLAQWLAAEGQLRRAETLLFEQVARNPGHGRAHLVLAELMRLGKRYDEAEKYYREALRLLPDDAAVAYNLGLMLQLANKPKAAAEAYAEACRRAPAFAPAVHNLAALKLASGDLDGAQHDFSRVLEIEPKHLNALYNLGRIAERRGNMAEAENRYVAVLRLNAGHPDALRALGSLLLRHNRNLDWAEKCLKAFIRQQPQSASAYHELGSLLGRVGRLDEAIPCYDAAIEFSSLPASAPARHELVRLLLAAGRIADAIGRLEDIVAIWPEEGGVLFELIRLKLGVCRWDGLAALCERLAALPDEALPDRPSPYPALAMPGLSVERRFAIARRNADRLLAQAKTAGFAGKKPRRRSAKAAAKQLRIGYLFSDLDHLAVSEALAEVVARHDPQRFEIYAYSFNAADASDSIRRVAASVHAFRPLGAASARQAGETIRADKLDVLVDLGGWINVQHAPVLATRPAPVVIEGWTYPASLGHDELADFLLADPFVVPEEAREPFAEPLLRLPAGFRPVASGEGAPTPPRAAVGLGEGAFVFCSFAPAYHLNPDVFDAWAMLLRDLPHAVLWLADPGEDARAALVEEAGKRGIGTTQLVFAPRVPRHEHLARLRLADAALDTFPLSAAQCALDALAAGVPVVALAGASYAGRVAAGLLDAAASVDLIAADAERYVAIARALAADPARSGEVRARFAAASMREKALDAYGFTRALDALYLRVATGANADG